MKTLPTIKVNKISQGKINLNSVNINGLELLLVLIALSQILAFQAESQSAVCV